MRLIDADAFKAEGRELYRCAGWDLRDVHYSQMDVECNIDYMPTIDAEPVKHGRWIKNPPTEAWEYHCSLCGTQEDYKENYCRNCGARMDGGEDGITDLLE